MAPVVKLLFESLDALLAELRDRKVEVVRVSPALEIETGPWAAGIQHLVSRVLVTAALGDHTWAEWRHWVGQAVAEIGRPELQVPTWLREQQDRALAEARYHLPRRTQGDEPGGAGLDAPEGLAVGVADGCRHGVRERR